MANKKIIFIILFAILLFLLGCSSVFASTSLTDLEGTTYILPDLPEEINGCPYIISRCEKYNTYCLLFVKSNDFSQFVNSDDDVILPVDASGNQCSDVYLAETKTLDNPTSWTTKKWGGLQPATAHHFIYANYNIYNTDGTVFFQPAPQGIVARQVEKVEMSQVLQEIITLLPLILVVVVSLAGLRKGLKMLETFLHQS
jgi:hypothetical protein